MLVFIVKQENAGYNDHHTGELTASDVSSVNLLIQ
jgi:hypothetical protein